MTAAIISSLFLAFACLTLYGFIVNVRLRRYNLAWVFLLLTLLMLSLMILPFIL